MVNFINNEMNLAYFIKKLSIISERKYLTNFFISRDLMSEDGVTLEVNNELDGVEEEFEYSKNVFMSNDDILKHLNLDMENDNEDDTAEQLMFNLNLSFEKLKGKMTDVLGNGKVCFFTKF